VRRDAFVDAGPTVSLAVCFRRSYRQRLDTSLQCRVLHCALGAVGLIAPQFIRPELIRGLDKIASERSHVLQVLAGCDLRSCGMQLLTSRCKQLSSRLAKKESLGRQSGGLKGALLRVAFTPGWAGCVAGARLSRQQTFIFQTLPYASESSSRLMKASSELRPGLLVRVCAELFLPSSNLQNRSYALMKRGRA
jgi:hypothetical protein